MMDSSYENYFFQSDTVWIENGFTIDKDKHDLSRKEVIDCVVAIRNAEDSC